MHDKISRTVSESNVSVGHFWFGCIKCSMYTTNPAIITTKQIKAWGWPDFYLIILKTSIYSKNLSQRKHFIALTQKQMLQSPLVLQNQSPSWLLDENNHACSLPWLLLLFSCFNPNNIISIIEVEAAHLSKWLIGFCWM